MPMTSQDIKVFRPMVEYIIDFATAHFYYL